MKRLLISLLIVAASAFAATDFSITNPTLAIGAGFPSRAMTITVTGGSVGGSTASFALSDGGAGGEFFPTSPVTIAANAPAGSTTQFVYKAAYGSSGSVTITVTATGGIVATNPITISIAATQTVVVSDTFGGANNTALSSWIPSVGGPGWVTAFSGTATFALDGSGNVKYSNTSVGAHAYIVPTAPRTQEFDASVDIGNFGPTKVYTHLIFNSVNSNTLTLYSMDAFTGFIRFVRYSGGAAVTNTLNTTIPAANSTFTMQASVRVINGLQYLFGYIIQSGVQTLQGAPWQQGDLTTGYPGIMAEQQGVGAAGATDNVYSNFKVTNADWGSPDQVIPFSDSRLFVPPGVCQIAAGTLTCPKQWQVKFNITGGTTGTIKLNTDTSGNSGSTSAQMPSVAAKSRLASGHGVADSVYTTTQLPANFLSSAQLLVLTIPSYNPALTYTVELDGLEADDSRACYTTSICSAIVKSVQVDNGATVTAATLRPKRCVFFMHSYGEASFGGSAAVWNQKVNWLWSWPYFFAPAAGCEESRIAVGTMGWTHAGDGGYPPFTSWWNTYASGVPRSFNGLGVDYAFIEVTENDHGASAASITSAVSSTITAMRSDFGVSTKFFIVPALNPFALGGDGSSGSLNTDVQAGVTAAADAGTTVVTLPAEFANAMFTTNGVPTWCSLDGLHPNGGSGSPLDGNCNGLIGYSVLSAFKDATAAGGSGSTMTWQ